MAAREQETNSQAVAGRAEVTRRSKMKMRAAHAPEMNPRAVVGLAAVGRAEEGRAELAHRSEMVAHGPEMIRPCTQAHTDKDVQDTWALRPRSPVFPITITSRHQRVIRKRPVMATATTTSDQRNNNKDGNRPAIKLIDNRRGHRRRSRRMGANVGGDEQWMRDEGGYRNGAGHRRLG